MSRKNISLGIFLNAQEILIVGEGTDDKMLVMFQILERL